MKIQDEPAKDSIKGELLFSKKNYYWWLLSASIVVLGFGLMYGTTDIYNLQKLVLAPIVILIGYGLGFIAIFKGGRKS